MGLQLYLSLLFLFLFNLIPIKGKAFEKSLFLEKENKTFIDSSGSLSILEVIKHEKGFQISTEKNSVIKSFQSVYWRKIIIQNLTPGLTIFYEGYPRFDVAELYIIDSLGNYSLQKAGIHIPIHSWRIRYPNKIVFEIPYSPTPQTLYFKLKANHVVGLGFTAVLSKAWINQNLTNYYFYGTFFGVLGIIAFYSLILFLTIKDQVYLFYFLYVLSFALFGLVHWNFIFQIIGMEKLVWKWEYYTIPYSLMTIFFLFYTRKFLTTKENIPILDKVITFLIVLRGIILIFGIITKVYFFFDAIIDTIFHLAAFGAGLIRIKQGYKPAKYFTMAFSILLVGLIVHAYNLEIYFPNNFFFTNALYITGIIEVGLFSVALSQRYKQEKNDKEKAHETMILQLKENSQLQQKVIFQLKENEELKNKVNLELEEKVRERTEQIRLQALEIERMNDLLREDKKRLEVNVKDLSKARVMQKKVSFEEFKHIYPDDETCYTFLANLKWHEGFICRKCNNKNFSQGKFLYSRRCTKCLYDESVTSHTIFYRLKFPIVKAFYLVFIVSEKRLITEEELSVLLSLRRNTCGSFKRKVISVIENYKKYNKKPFSSWEALLLFTSPEPVED